MNVFTAPSKYCSGDSTSSGITVWTSSPASAALILSKKALSISNTAFTVLCRGTKLSPCTETPSGTKCHHWSTSTRWAYLLILSFGSTHLSVKSS